MNKRRLHHLWTKLRWIKPQYFLILAVVSGIVCVFALRANNQHMIQLRNEVYQADKSNGDVQGSLRNLQAYVTSHMNTDLSTGQNTVYPPLQLKYTYDRLLKARNNAEESNKLYNEAQAYCEGLNANDFSGRNRVPCIEQYVSQRGGSTADLAPIPDAMYKFSFTSPAWSPDLAGFSLLATIIFGLAFIVSLIGRVWFKRNVL